MSQPSSLDCMHVCVHILRTRYLKPLGRHSALKGITFLSFFVYKYIADTAFIFVSCLDTAVGFVSALDTRTCHVTAHMTMSHDCSICSHDHVT